MVKSNFLLRLQIFLNFQVPLNSSQENCANTSVPSNPAAIYLLKVNNRNTRTKAWNIFKVWRRFGVFIVNFEHISYFCFSVSIVNFEHVIAGWESSTVSQFWQFPSFLAAVYLLKVKVRKLLTSSGVFNVNFGHISHIILAFPLFTLKVASAIFLLVCLRSLKNSILEAGKNVFYFSTKTQFSTFQILKCHDVIKCLSMKEEIHFTE